MIEDIKTAVIIGLVLGCILVHALEKGWITL